MSSFVTIAYLTNSFLIGFSPVYHPNRKQLNRTHWTMSLFQEHCMEYSLPPNLSNRIEEFARDEI